MRKSITTVLVAFGLFLSVFLTSSAMAGGFAIGILGAVAEFTTTGNEKEGTGDFETNSAAKQRETLPYGSFFAEYTLGEVIGLTFGASYTPFEGELGAKTRSDTTTEDVHATRGGSNDTGTYSAKATVNDQTSIYLEPTYMPTRNFGLFLKAGLARVTVKSLESIALGDDSSAYGDETVDGLMYGVGVKGVSDSGLFFKLEVIHINYDEVKMTSETGNKNIITAQPQQLAGRLAIGYKF